MLTHLSKNLKGDYSNYISKIEKKNTQTLKVDFNTFIRSPFAGNFLATHLDVMVLDWC